MRRFRSRIGTLSLVVLIMGVSLAALRESDVLWEAGVFTVTVGVLLNAVLLTVHRTAEQRAFWLGFALFGAVSLGLSVVPSIESRLITTRALVYVDCRVHPSVPAGAGLMYADLGADGWLDLFITNNPQANRLYVARGNGTFQDISASAGMTSAGNLVLVNPALGPWPAGSSEHFLRIGHSLFALIAAWIGGRISRHLHTKNRQATQTASPANPQPPVGMESR